VVAVLVGVFVTIFSQVVVTVFVFVVLLVFAGLAETTGSSGNALWQVATGAATEFWLAEIIGDVLKKARKTSATNGAKITFPRFLTFRAPYFGRLAGRENIKPYGLFSAKL
jgi:hypothetical protein